MSQTSGVTNDLDKKIEEIEKTIITYNEIIEGLKWQRYELLSSKHDLDMNDVLECIIEKGLSANEVLKMINGVKTNEYVNGTGIKM